MAIACLAGSLPLAGADSTESQGMEAFLSTYAWSHGPQTARMGEVAQIKVPPGFMFTGGADTRRLLQDMGNLTAGTEVGFLAPTSLVWFVVFRFSEDGYVKDDGKDRLDPEAMLTILTRGAEFSNQERRKRGYPEMTIIGWDVEPRYDEATHNLEWAVRGESEGLQIVNYNTRILGRRGVMEVKLVVSPSQLEATLPAYRQVLSGYTYQPGQAYAEYRQGDRVAHYGLAALVTGGAVAAAAKSGLLAWFAVFFKKFWKLLVILAVGVLGWFQRILFGRRRPERHPEGSP